MFQHMQGISTDHSEGFEPNTSSPWVCLSPLSKNLAHLWISPDFAFKGIFDSLSFFVRPQTSNFFSSSIKNLLLSWQTYRKWQKCHSDLRLPLYWQKLGQWQTCTAVDAINWSSSDPGSNPCFEESWKWDAIISYVVVTVMNETSHCISL